MKKGLVLIAIASISLACSLAPSTAPASSAAPATGDSFSKFVDDYFDARFNYLPSQGTDAGFHEYDTKLEDRSRARIEARIAELKSFLSRLQALDRSKLSFDEAIDADALDGEIRSFLLDQETLRNWERNPMGYAGLPGGAADSLIKRDFAPAAERLRSLVSREKLMPAVYAAAKANLVNPPKEFTDLAIRMAKGSAGYFAGTVARWAKEAAGSDAALWKDFEQANAQVVAATRAFASWLEKDLLPRSKGSYAIGAANFLAKMKSDDMVEMPLAELLAKGEAQLAKDSAAFVETAKKIDPSKTPAQVMKSLSDEHPTPENLIPSVAQSVENARKFLVEKDLVTIPSEVRPRVEETPPFARSGSFASMDTPGAYETKATEAFYYVTPVEPEWDAKHKEEHLRLYNPYVVAIIDVHEVWPGHYLQFLYAPKFPTKTRKLVFCGTNAEGWAHYSEQMMVDQGFGGGDPKYRLAQLQEALLRDCRYVVGIKLHTQGMTVEEGARVFVEKGFQEPANAYEEARRGAYNPTYLYYTLGKLMIQDLSNEYRAKTGASLKGFHDAFVAQGGLPIPLVRRVLFRAPAATAR
ncbi:MAG TPA: DUF885 domain-containing protein [Thermoanaerobaculia bacterium]|jgi:uncharacterized protein (DUF885 family)|nr:DUF885 domain-containing protein [Thermoanaerobaculia bacterium]